MQLRLLQSQAVQILLTHMYMLVQVLVAKKAVEKGMEVPKFVKTSLAPGSKVVTGYLRDAGLLPYLDKLDSILLVMVVQHVSVTLVH